LRVCRSAIKEKDMTIMAMQNYMEPLVSAADMLQPGPATAATGLKPRKEGHSRALGGNSTQLRATPRGSEANGMSVNDIYALMALFSKTAQQARTACRHMRQQELDAFQDAAGLAAQAMREAGQHRFVGSLLSGGAQCFGAVASMAGGVWSIANTLKANDLQNKAATCERSAEHFLSTASGAANPVEARALESYAQAMKNDAIRHSGGSQTLLNHSYNLSMMSGGMSGLAGGAAASSKAVFDLSAAEEDAKRLIFETQSRVCENRMQAEERVMQDRYAELQDLREKLNAIAQSQLESNRTVARNL
jgi:hypothetical protein